MTVRGSAANDDVECVRCSRDKHIPKMYSAANNMNPGSLPPELMVVYMCMVYYCMAVNYFVLISVSYKYMYYIASV